MSSITYSKPAASAKFNSSSASRSTSHVPSNTAIWLAVGAISMSFAALTSALIVRQDIGLDWKPFALPRILYVNTALLLLSSLTLQIARKQIAIARTGGEMPWRLYPKKWLYATLTLALLFVGGQIFAWRDLAAQGLFLATNPSSSFFYVFTGLHAAHVLGGMLGLLYASHRMARNARIATASPLDVAAVYWHFMAVLWVYLLLIIRIRM